MSSHRRPDKAAAAAAAIIRFPNAVRGKSSNISKTFTFSNTHETAREEIRFSVKEIKDFLFGKEVNFFLSLSLFLSLYTLLSSSLHLHPAPPSPPDRQRAAP